MSVRRFAYVGVRNGGIAHRFYSTKFTEGEQAACGIRVQPGWRYWFGMGKLFGKPTRRICKRCEAVK